MPTFLKLDAHFVERTCDSIAFGNATTTIRVSDTFTVQMPTPFQLIGDELAITPRIVADGPAAVRIDFTKWSPLRVGPRGTFGFPFSFTGQEMAVKVARAFDADRRMTWQHTTPEIETWLRQHAAALGLSF